MGGTSVSIYLEDEAVKTYLRVAERAGMTIDKYLQSLAYQHIRYTPKRGRKSKRKTADAAAGAGLRLH